MSMISIERAGFQEKQTQKKIFAKEKTLAWSNQTANQVTVQKTLSDIHSCFVISGTAVRLCIPVQSWCGCRQCLWTVLREAGICSTAALSSPSKWSGIWGGTGEHR